MLITAAHGIVQITRHMDIWPFLHLTTIFQEQSATKCVKCLLSLTCVRLFVCQREGTLGDDDSADGENGRGFEEYEWAGQKRIRATALLEGGFRGTNTRTHTSRIPTQPLPSNIVTPLAHVGHAC